jgi:hypothetical protein
VDARNEDLIPGAVFDANNLLDVIIEVQRCSDRADHVVDTRQRPPQVTIAALVSAGLKKIFSRGPANSTESGCPFLSVSER